MVLVESGGLPQSYVRRPDYLLYAIDLRTAHKDSEPFIPKLREGKEFWSEFIEIHFERLSSLKIELDRRSHVPTPPSDIFVICVERLCELYAQSNTRQKYQELHIADSPESFNNLPIAFKALILLDLGRYGHELQLSGFNENQVESAVFLALPLVTEYMHKVNLDRRPLAHSADHKEFLRHKIYKILDDIAAGEDASILNQIVVSEADANYVKIANASGGGPKGDQLIGRFVFA